MRNPETSSDPLANCHFPPRLEAPTELPYVKLRNWSEVVEKNAEKYFQTNAQERAMAARSEEPNNLWVDYRQVIATSLRRIDHAGRVAGRSLLTGEECMTEPIAITDLTEAGVEQRTWFSQLCAQEILTAVDHLIGRRNLFYNDPEAQQIYRGFYEGHIAQGLAPYREDTGLIEEISTLLEQAQAEGQLAILYSAPPT